MIELLKDAYDLHIHCAPDVIPRLVTGYDMAKRARDCGMRGFAMKAHYGCTCQMAALVNELVPECHAVGSLTMNSATGGISPMAVETACRLGAGIIWCPTFDSAAQQKLNRELTPQHIVLQCKLLDRGMRVPSYSLIDEEGRLTKDMSDVLSLVQEYNVMLGTGHVTHEETFALAREAHRRNFRKLVITHADWEFTHYSIEEKLELVRLGATIEHSWTSPAVLHSLSFEETFAEMRAVGAEHVIVSTDLGANMKIYPDEGLLDYAERILQAGFSRDELRLMLVENPARLVEA